MVDLKPLDQANRLLFMVPLRPVQGDRFQPTGFPNLGAATYQTEHGQKLLVESAQSMANRMETACWDPARNGPVKALDGISHVTVTRKQKFLTDSMLEAHRINSPYLLAGKDRKFIEHLRTELGGLEEGPIDRKKLAEVLLKYDVVNPSGDAKSGFGNVPFARDEFVAKEINCYINLDLAQIRGYGLDDKVQNLLVLLALHRVRKLLDGDLRLRTACDLEPVDRENLEATRPKDYGMPSQSELDDAVKSAIENCKSLMTHTTVTFEDDLKKAKQTEDKDDDAGDETDSNESPDH